MEVLQPCPILEFHPDQLFKVRKFYGYEDVKKLNEALDLLQVWIEKQNHFECGSGYVPDRKLLEVLLLMSCKGSIEKAKKRMDRLLTFRTLMPEITQNLKIKTEFTNLVNTVHHCVLPKLTEDLYRLSVVQFYGDVNDLNILDFGRFEVVLAEYMADRDYTVGYELIADARMAGPSLITKMNPIILGKIATITTQGYGVKVKAIHLLSGSRIVDTLASLLKQVLSEKIGSRIKIHTTIESLQKDIPKALLPSDYGGELKSVEHYADATFQELSSEEHIERIKNISQCKVNESKRLASNFNEEYSGMPGSFRSLSVD